MKVNILGTEYEVEFVKGQKKMADADANGYIENYSKKIYIDDFEPDNLTVEKLDKFKEKVLRHEIIHAYFFESGLDVSSDYARNEELVDWLALQIPKMAKTFKELNILE